jgi:phage recombination protein Bet
MNDKAIIKHGQDAGMLEALRNTIAPGLSDGEFQLFAEMARATGLNPALKELWAIKAGGRLQLMTGINGFLKIANAHPQFDGLEVTFEREGSQIVSATAKVYRKDRRIPATATAYMSEYRKATPVWQTMPSVMLSKCAKALAIREAFVQELSGLYAQEEMPPEYALRETRESKRAVNLIEGASAVVDERTGEVLGYTKGAPSKRPISEARAVISDSKKAEPTRYDISSLTESREAAEEYLRSRSAIDLGDGVWLAPEALPKLKRYEVAAETLEEGEVEKGEEGNEEA